MLNLLKSKLFRNICLLLTGTVIFLCCGCNMQNFDATKAEDNNQSDENIDVNNDVVNNLNEESIIDNQYIYSQDVIDSVEYFYVTVRKGSAARGTNHTFEEINNAVRFLDGAHNVDDIYAEALVQVGDENGPLQGKLGYGETKSNATIRVRGNSSSLLPVKSYKLSLNDNAGLWRGQSNIALNKHAFDVTRFRNKLYFDLLKEIPQVPSIRTQFVRLFIKDETSGATEFEDYGIFTQAEVPTKKYLKNHGMDSAGYLYKAISFNFEMSQEIKNYDDPSFNEAAFETVLSCKGRKDNTRLIEMINAVNDTSNDIDYIIDNYFDRDNYEYWLAYNILMSNLDTTMQNFYLYSPLNGNKWYFIPWDGDACLYEKQWELEGQDKYYAPWESGISQYWGISLHKRFLKYEKNRIELKEKVDELYSLLSKEKIEGLISVYNDTIEKYVLSTPDIKNLGHTVDERDYVISTLYDVLESNYEKFNNSLNSLMPFFIYSPVVEDDKVIFTWQDAYDFEGRKVYYSIRVSEYPDMSNPILVEEQYESTKLVMDKNIFSNDIPYYICVYAQLNDGKSVGAFNKASLDEVFYISTEEFWIE